MSLTPELARNPPSRKQAALFQGKAALFKLRRAVSDLGAPIRRQQQGPALAEAPILGEASSEIWNHQSAAEFPLTAGKVQNLRVACTALHGLQFPAGAPFSFWKQLGRTTLRKGYVSGRELREGCLVAQVGGGLCQLSNLLYNAALDGGLEILERHPHSRLIPGSLAEKDRDATVFWNYVDLRFRARIAFRLEAILSATHLTIRLRAQQGEQSSLPAPHPATVTTTGAPVRSSASGDCLTCGMASCFRHPGSSADHPLATGHTAFLLDEHWPEFQAWCRQHSREGDHWLLPLDGERWKKPNYAWSPPKAAEVRYATCQTLHASFRTRRIPPQGVIRQRALLSRDRSLAHYYARKLEPSARHLIISQNLLPHLWQCGALGGRTFDVLITRWPLLELQRRLDHAARLHSASPTLADFRAAPELVVAESEALDQAARLVTPHRAIAAHFGSRALLLDWHLPKARDQSPHPRHHLFFPASPLARKGIYELSAALQSLDVDLLVLGGASEGTDPVASLPHRRATPSDLFSARALVLPAWIEHQPRLALRALANEIPVVASAACGLPEHPFLWQIEEPNPDALHACLSELLASDARQPSPCAP